MNLLIVNKSRFFYEMLTSILQKSDDVENVYFGDNGQTVKEAISRGVDVAIISPNSMEASYQIRRKWNMVDAPYKRVTTTTEISTQLLLSAVRLGFDGVMDLTKSPDTYVPFLRRVRRGEEKVSSHPLLVSARLDDALLREVEVVYHDFTDHRIVSLLAMGLSDKEIAASVFLSCQTVRNRISRMLQVSGARNRTQLAVRHLGDISWEQRMASPLFAPVASPPPDTGELTC